MPLKYIHSECIMAVKKSAMATAILYVDFACKEVCVLANTKILHKVFLAKIFRYDS